MPNHGYVALTRDEGGNARWQKQLERAGFEPYLLPCIRTVPLELTSATNKILGELGNFDWIVFTSPVAVRYFSALIKSRAMGAAKISSIRIGVVGEATAKAAQETGWAVDFVPSLADSETLGRELHLDKSSKVLWPHSAKAPHDLAELLRKYGTTTVDISIYKTEMVAGQDQHFEALLVKGEIRAIIFASPSAVEGFQYRIEKAHWNAVLVIPVVVTGMRTAEAARAVGFKVVIEASRPTIEAVIEQLRMLLKQTK